jgi:superfamily II DNA or RNA helicase
MGRRSKIGKILGDETIKDRPKILVASFGTLSTGINIKNLHYVLFMDSFKSEQIIIQSIGRILRLHKDKDKAVVFDIVDIFDDRTRRKNTLYQHYLLRRGFYNKREYPVEELKINLGDR